MTDAKTWGTRVAEWRASQQTAKVFCEGKAFSRTSLYAWASKLKTPGAVPLAKVVREAAMPPRGRGQIEIQSTRVFIPAELGDGLLSEVVKQLLYTSGERR